VTFEDAEGDECILNANTTMVIVNRETGRIHFEPDSMAVGVFTFGLELWDSVTPQLRRYLNFSVTVENVNDPMSDPTIQAPLDGSNFEKGQEFNLSAHCSDPDIEFGQILNFTWGSNVSGLIGYGPDLIAFLNTSGWHTITLVVRDPDFEKSTTVEVFIKKATTGPSDPGNGDGDVGLMENPGFILLILIVLAVLGVTLFVISNRRRQMDEVPEYHPPSAEPADGTDELVELSHELGSAISALESQRAIDRANGTDPDYTPPPPPPQTSHVPGQAPTPVQTPAPGQAPGVKHTAPPPTPAVLDITTTTLEVSPEEQAEREAARAEREIMRILTQLPRGLPTSFWGKDLTELTREILSAPKRTSAEGAPLVRLGSKWYFADLRNVGTYLQEWKEEKKEKKDTSKDSSFSAEERAQRMEKADTMLLEGKISEETYERLRKKYEG
jgi:hypothetical protein